MSSMVSGSDVQKLARFLWWTSGAAVLALALAGCGGGGGGGSADVTPGAPASEPANPVSDFGVGQQSVTAPGATAPARPASGNMVANPGFENGMSGWIDWGNTSVVSGQVNPGSSALSVGPGAGGAGQVVGGIVPGHTYRLTAQARVSDASETEYIGVNFVDATGAQFTQNSVLVHGTSSVGATFAVVAPPGAVNALVYVWKNAGSGVAYVDDIGLADAGAAAAMVESTSNLVVDGGFESGFAHWAGFGSTIWTAAQPAAGANAARVGTGSGGFLQPVGGIVPGNTYRVSALAKVSTPEEIGYLGVMFTDDAGSGLLAQNAVFRSTSYATVQADVTAPAGATKALVFAWKNGGNGFAYVDEVSLHQTVPGSSTSGSATVLANANTTGRGVAVLNNGLRVAGWSDATGVHAQLFDAQGGLAGSAVAIAPAGNFSGVAALAGGGYVVEYDVPDEVLVQVVSPAGTLAGAPAVVRTQAQVEAELTCCQHVRLAGGTGVYPLGNGGFVAEFRETYFANVNGDSPASLMAQTYDASGNALGVPGFLASETFPWLSTTTSTPSGGVIVATNVLCSSCPDGGVARFLVYDNTLHFVGALDSPPPDATRSQRGAQLTDGTEVAIWTVNTHGVPPAVKGELYVPGSGLSPVTTFANVAPDARLTALAGGGFLLSWGNFAQAFDARGNAVGGVMQILDGSIAATPDGGFVVVAQVGTQLVEQQYAVGG